MYKTGKTLRLPSQTTMEISSAATMIGTFGATQQPLPRIVELQPEPSFAKRIQGNRRMSFGFVFDAPQNKQERMEMVDILAEIVE